MEAIISLVVGVVADWIHDLTQKPSYKAKLEHKDAIKRKADELLFDIHRRKLRNTVWLVNIKRRFKDYPSNKEKRLEGYSHIPAGIKSTRFDGIEFFEGMPTTAYKKENGLLSLKGSKNDKAFTVFPVGIVPYEWIENIDTEGDEYSLVPLFYCYFKGWTNWNFWKQMLFFGYPYIKIVYYRLSNVYDERNDPPEMKYSRIDQPISRS